MSLRREQEVLSIFFLFKMFRSSYWRCYVKKMLLNSLQNPRKNTCFGVYFLLKQRLQYRYFPVNFAKILRKSFLQNIFGRHLLNVFCGRLPHFIHKERERDVVPKFRDHYLPLKHTISKA